MIILGVDPGVAATGWAVLKAIEQGSNMTIEYGVVRTKAGIPMPERLSKIYYELSKIIREFKPDVCAIEEIYFGKNAKTAMMVGQARGVAVLAAVRAKVEVSEFTPLQVKTAVTGYGRAEKIQMQKMVKRLLGLSEVPKSDDAADALAIAICCAATRKVQSSKCKVKS